MTAYTNAVISSPIVVGRANELVALQSWLEAAAQGDGATILISGEAGIGKSRLLREAYIIAGQLGYRVVEGNCFEEDYSLPFAPFVDLLRRIDPALLQQSQFLDVASQLLKLVPEISTHFPHVLAEHSTEPEQEKRNLLRAWARWLTQLHASEHATSATLIVIEDLHWCDDLSLELLLLLARMVSKLPIALLLSYRSDEQHLSLQHFVVQLVHERLIHELKLTPLSDEMVETLIRTIFSQDRPISKEFAQAIIPLTEGNPFFIEEVLKSLVTKGDIFFAHGYWDRKQLNELQVPRTVMDTMQHRAAQLTEEAQQVLAFAAVVGRRIRYDLLQEVAQLTEAALLPFVKVLLKAQFLVEESSELLAFRHALTREAILARLLKRERKPLHHTIAETLERMHSAALDPYAGELAYHFFQASVWDKAYHYAMQAGDRAQSLFAPREALQHYELALQATQASDQPIAFELLRAKAHMHDTLGQWDAARDAYEVALRRARVENNLSAEWQCLLDLGFLWTGRDFRQSREHLQHALDVARRLNDSTALAHSLNRVGNWEANAQQPERSRQYHIEALELFRAANDRAGEAQTYDLLGTEGYILGDVPFAAQSYAQAIKLFRDLDNRSGLAFALAMSSLQGTAYALDTTVCVATPLHDCVAMGEEAIRLTQAIGARSMEAYAHMIFALALGPRGAWRSAMMHAQQALTIAIETNHDTNIASARWAIGAIYQDMLDANRAQPLLAESLTMLQGRGSEFLLGHVRACLARVHINTSAGNSRAQQELATAEQVLGALQEASTPMQTVWQRALWAARAELLLARAQFEDALFVIERLLRMTHGIVVPRLWFLRGAALSGLKRYAEAETVLQAACEGCEIYGMQSLLWRIRIALGNVQHVLRHPQQAQANYDAARIGIERLANSLLPTEAQHFTECALALVPSLPQPTLRQIAKAAHDGLTARECEVAALVARGKTNRDIGKQLILSERTVEKHIENVKQKLGFATRAQLAVWAAGQNLRE